MHLKEKPPSHSSSTFITKVQAYLDEMPPIMHPTVRQVIFGGLQINDVDTAALVFNKMDDTLLTQTLEESGVDFKKLFYTQIPQFCQAALFACEFAPLGSAQSDGVCSALYELEQESIEHAEAVNTGHASHPNKAIHALSAHFLQ